MEKGGLKKTEDKAVIDAGLANIIPVRDGIKMTLEGSWRSDISDMCYWVQPLSEQTRLTHVPLSIGFAGDKTTYTNCRYLCT